MGNLKAAVEGYDLSTAITSRGLRGNLDEIFLSYSINPVKKKISSPAWSSKNYGGFMPKKVFKDPMGYTDGEYTYIPKEIFLDHTMSMDARWLYKIYVMEEKSLAGMKKYARLSPKKFKKSLEELRSRGLIKELNK